ncbi:PP2C family protein-serine/threonine phosphatase [Ktedonobacter robiniae]|uniref:PP2C family protein-serine/threonine phosphatase n=1 Tax=Ktedonobacter robiniae TaxID=2778365 RepID=UPI001F25212B|nr:PP2C family serine/threonine-protein phosphatase [Ktedonobacter robiniae]
MNQPMTSLQLNHFLIESANHMHPQRSQSEDYVLVNHEKGLLGVFDSVGGRDQNLLVSHLAGQTISSAFDTLLETDSQLGPTEREAVLRQLIQLADTAIASLALPPEQRRPATTIALGILSVLKSQVFFSLASIGDSRIYLLRNGQPLQRLTEDHGYFSFAIEQGRLSVDESRRIEQARNAQDLSSCDKEHFEKRNKITCAVGWSDFTSIPTRSLALLPGDRVVFCTDGIHDNLTDQEIEDILLASTKNSAQRLVSTAYHRSQQPDLRAKPDDISVIHVLYQPH